jgi:predicted metal-dependent hydrolase
MADFPVIVKQTARRRSASVEWTHGPALLVTLPLGLSPADQQQITTSLLKRVNKRHHQHMTLLAQSRHAQLGLHITDLSVLQQRVNQINEETLKAPLAGVKLGRAWRRQMAQMNCRTRIMTVSRFVLQDIPAGAFRYLIIHELCHLTHANHSPAFWQLVARHMPDWAQHDAMLAAHHYQLTLTHMGTDLTAVTT